MKADIVLTNGKICTVDPCFRFVQSIAIKGRWILDTGSDADMKRYVGGGSEIVDLKGKLVLPGAHDEHCHAAYAGLYWQPGFVDAHGMTTLAEIGTALGKAAAVTPKGEWIIGGGVNRAPKGIRSSRLDRYDLDLFAPEHPVLLNDSGLHGLFLNSKALEMAGIGKNTQDIDPAVGRISRDESGEPTGFFLDFAAQSAAMRHVRQLSGEKMKEAVLRAQAELNKHGVTTHTDIAGPGGDNLFCGTWGMQAVEAYERLNRAGKLTCRCVINIFPGIDGVQSYDAIIGGLDGLRLPVLSDPLRVNAKAIKIFGDLGWRRKEEALPDNMGNCTFPGGTEKEQIENITRTIMEAHRRDWQIGIHMTGGRGIDVAISAFIKAQQTYPGKDLRHFIIHADEMSDKNIRDCARHHIMISAQAIAPYSFMGSLVRARKGGMGEDMFDYHRYITEGIMVAQGSDAPTMSHNWLLGLQFMLTRRTKSGEVFRPHLVCGIEEGIRMYTTHGAYQNHMEQVCGSLEPGKLADIQVLGADIFRLNAMEMGNVPVIMTICNGEIVYQA
jgi:predicted amidohydrolase YtcJ